MNKLLYALGNKLGDFKMANIVFKLLFSAETSTDQSLLKKSLESQDMIGTECSAALVFAFQGGATPWVI